MPKQTELALKVQAMHADHPKAPNGPAAHVLNNHIIKQEQIVFPMPISGASAMTGGAIAVTQSGLHEDPGVKQSHRDLLEHSWLENEILFQRLFA